MVTNHVRFDESYFPYRKLSVIDGVFGILRLDPETVLILLTTTRIPDRFYRTGTVVGPCPVDDLRSCAVTSTVTTEPLFPVLDIIETEDNKTLLPHSDRRRFRRGNYRSFELTRALNPLLFDLIRSTRNWLSKFNFYCYTFACLCFQHESESDL